MGGHIYLKLILSSNHAHIVHNSPICAFVFDIETSDVLFYNFSHPDAKIDCEFNVLRHLGVVLGGARGVVRRGCRGFVHPVVLLHGGGGGPLLRGEVVGGRPRGLRLLRGGWRRPGNLRCHGAFPSLTRLRSRPDRPRR